MRKFPYPELDFCISFPLQSYILGAKFDFKELKFFKQSFATYVKRYGKKILMLISRYVGLRWETRKIKIWLVDAWYPSISYPLLLNIYDRDKRFVFFTLIHELVHNILLEKNILTKKGRMISMPNLEAIVELVTKKVAENIFPKRVVKKLCKEAEFGGTYKFIWEKEAELEKKWDLDKKPLIRWIKKEGRYTIQNENRYF